MSAPVFIGDEISAAGYRLAGLQVRTPTAEDLPEVIHWACQQAPLVLISSAYAALLPKADTERLLSQVSPPVVLVPEIGSTQPGRELAMRMRAQLGVLE